MLDIDTISAGDELPAETAVLCCGDVMDSTGATWTCGCCNAVIETSNGLISDIR